MSIRSRNYREVVVPAFFIVYLKFRGIYKKILG